jgi:hypothetical protein
MTKLTPEEIHKLATAPFPTFNIIKSSYGVGAGKILTKYGLGNSDKGFDKIVEKSHE